MGLFNNKPKVGVEEFCREFYDTQILHPIIAGEDVGAVFWETAFNSVVEADASFAAIDLTLFRREMTAIRLELFGLAWGHKFKQDKFSIPQSVFTRHYLEENEKLELWDIMGEYNQAIAQSVTMTESGGQMDNLRVAKVNKARFDLYKNWIETNIGDSSKTMTKEEEDRAKCVARVANRIGADIRRNDCILVKRLTARLADRLDCDPNLDAEALFRLGAVIFGLHEGAIEAIESVEPHPELDK